MGADFKWTNQITHKALPNASVSNLWLLLVFDLQIEKWYEIFKPVQNLPNQLRILNRLETSDFKDKPALLWENVLFVVLIDQ